tara:strand:- start:6255 stop:6449 length:195 start_codon:yes stop_codon:yes gene_type:complete
MGLLDRIKGKKEEKQEEVQKEVPRSKYDEVCSLCNEPGTEKKWMGQYWHKKCLRKSKKFAKGMM